MLVVLLSLTCSCHHTFDDGVRGSGTRQKQKRDVASFSSISTEGAFDIEVVCQKPLSLEIASDDNILPLITTEVSNNVLHIRNLRNYSVDDPVTVKISIPNLEGLRFQAPARSLFRM